MEKVFLQFRSIDDLTAFVLTEKISGLEVITGERKVQGLLTEKQIRHACKEYGAFVISKKELHFTV